jgi:transcription initiation factor IIE alpha subunit
MIPLPRLVWHRIVASDARNTTKELQFMSEEHHAVRNYVVAQLPRSSEPMSPDAIAQGLGMQVDSVRAILDDLERHMTFVCRYGRREVNWAYPVTVDETPHRVDYGSGEQGYAA